VKSLANKLRKQQTDAEKLLWRRLRNRQLAGCKFRRQHKLGPYFVDLVCLERKVIVEIDGGQHIEQMGPDLSRTAFLHAQNFTVIRFWNNDVLIETESVLEAILAALKSPSPQPSPTRGEGVL